MSCRNRFSQKQILFVLLLVCFALNCLAADYDYYVVEGTFSVREGMDLSDESREDINTFRGNFRLLSKGCTWIMRWSQSNEPFDYQECGTDGNYLYTARSVESQARRKREAGGAVANDFIGNIQSGFLPNPGTVPIVPAFWWAFASGYYLNTNSGKLFPVISYTDLSYAEALCLSGQRQPAYVSVNQALPSLPNYVAFMDDGIQRGWPQVVPKASEWGNMQKSKRVPPYDAGFTNCILRVLEFTNIDSFTFPLVLDIRVYAPKSKGKLATDLDWRRQYSILLTNVSFSDSNMVTTVPKVVGKMFTSDLRFIDDSPTVMKFGYVADKKWLSEQESKNTKAYQEALNDARRAFSKAGISGVSSGMETIKKKIIIFVILLTTIVIPVVVVSVGRKVKKQNN